MTSGLSKGLLEGLKRSERLFQAKMKRLYEKYDHAFEDDIVVNIIDFTCSSPDGPIPWDCETKTTGEGKHTKSKTPDKEQQSAYIQVLPTELHSSEILEEALNSTCLLPMEASDGVFSRTFIIGEKSESKDSDLSQLEHYEPSYTTGNLSPSIKLSAGTKETCLTDGHKQSLMPNTVSNIGNKTFFVSPLDTSVPMQIKSFIRRQNKDCSFEDTREVSFDYQADESRLQQFKEAAYYDSGDTSLAYYYPDMVECIRRLWELPGKKRAADHIVQYYKRHVWNTYKKLATKQMFYRLSNSRSMHLNPLQKYEAFKGCTGYIHKLYHSKSAVHRLGKKTFTANSNKDRSSISLKKFFTKQQKVDAPEIHSCMKEQNRQILVMKHSPVRRNISSMFPLLHSPKAESKMACKILDKTFTYQNQIETHDSSFSSSYNDTSPLLEVTSALSKSQGFPLLHNPINNTVPLSHSMESEATTLCKMFSNQTQGERYNTGSFYINKLNRQSFMYTKQPETCDASYFQENVKRFPKVAGTPPRLSPGKHSVMLNCRLDPNKTSLDNTFICQNTIDVNKVNSFNIKEQDKQFPGSSFSAFPVLQSPRKNIVTLSSSMEGEVTDSYKSFLKQNQVKSDSSYIKEQKRQNFKYIKQETPDVNSSFQENIKWLPEIEATPPRKSPGKHSVMLKRRINPCNTSVDNTFICQNSVETNEVKYFDGKEQDKKPSHLYTLVRRNSFSALPSVHSPKSHAKSFFSLNNTTVSLDKTITYQDDLKAGEIASSCNREHTRQLLKLEESLARHNSFSPLPVLYSLVSENKIPDVNFDDIYKMKNQNGSHPNVRVQSSEMVLSLVNSPGSLRCKRGASKNLSFSTFKRRKSADATFIQSFPNATHHSVDKSSLLWQETTDFIPKFSPKFSGWS